MMRTPAWLSQPSSRIAALLLLLVVLLAMLAWKLSRPPVPDNNEDFRNAHDQAVAETPPRHPAPEPPPPRPLKPEETPWPGESVELPGRVVDVSVAGDRFLLLTLEAPRRLAFFDARDGELTRVLPLPSAESIVVAGAEQFLVIAPDHGVFERWRLDPPAKELTAPLPVPGFVHAAAMGARSSGPVLLRWEPEGQPGLSEHQILSLMDPETATLVLELNPVRHNLSQGYAADTPYRPVGPDSLSVIRPGAGVHVEGAELRAAANGTAFAVWGRRSFPQGLCTIVLRDDGSVHSYYRHEDPGYTVPDDLGETVYTLEEGVYSIQLARRLSGLPADVGYLPAHGLAVILGYQGDQLALYHRDGGGKPLLQLGRLVELGPARTANAGADASDPIWDKRLHYFAEAGRLVTIPRDRTELVVRNLNLRERLLASDRDFLLVTSVPPYEASRGRRLTYPVTALARQEPVALRLVGGPDGMELATNGTLTWDVPAEFPDDQANVVISIRDSSDQETFHTFTLEVH